MKLTEIKVMTEEQILAAPMMEMANLPPANTGLPLFIWFGEVGGQHGPRVKVSNTPGKFNRNSNFVVSVTKEPQVLTPKSVDVSQDKVDDVVDWIKLNYDILMAMWKIYESGDGDLIAELQRLRKI